MQKKLMSLILSVAMVLAFTPFVSAENNLVTSAAVVGNEITISGTAVSNANVTVTLFKPGVTRQQAAAAKTREEIKECIEYTNILTVSKDGKYEYNFNAAFESNKTYTLYVTDGKNEYSLDILSNEEENSYVDFITYSGDDVNVIGHTAGQEEEVTISLTDENGEIIKALNIVSDDTGNYNCKLENVLAESEKYNLYVSINNKASDEVYAEHYIVGMPQKIYVNSQNADGESVFSSITDARNYLRTNLRNVPVDVIISGGNYKISEAIELSEADKRTVDTMVTYKNADNEPVSINGKKQLDIDAFESVTDNSVLERMYENVRNKVVVTDLKAQGVSSEIINFTKAYDDPNRIGLTVKVPLIFLNGERQTLAKWPNSGYKYITTVVSSGASSSDTTLYDGAIFKYNSSIISRWEQAEDMFIEGYLKWTYFSEWAKVKEIAGDSGRITLKYRTFNGLVNTTTDGIRWKAVNLLEELDMPGEWYIDRSKSLLYYYPPYELQSGKDILEIAELNDDLIRCSDTKYIAFDGIDVSGNFDITFGNGITDGYENGIETKNSEHILINNCFVHDVMGNGICISNNSTGVRVSDCLINNIGINGVSVSGGDRDALTSCKNIVTGCDISKVSMSNGGNGTNGIKLNCIGGIAENNTIHCTRTNGIGYLGSENIIRNNELYFNSYETADSGAIYSGRKWTTGGNIIEKNVIHDLGPLKPVGKELWMVYWDDGLSGNTMKNNILIGNPERSDIRGLQIAQGPNNNAYDNTFVNFAVNPIDAVYSADGLYAAAATLTASPALPYDSELYMAKYPFFARLAALKLDSGNSEERNYSDYRENLEIKGNVTLNSELLTDYAQSTYGIWWANKRGFEGMDKVVEENTALYDSKYFVNPSQNDYRIKSELLQEAGIAGNVNSDANFDMNSIGSKAVYSKEQYTKFALVYPANGEGIGKRSLTIKWSESALADVYKYQVSTDKDFTDIVSQGVTNYTNAQISGLSADTKYYWRVYAVNYGINSGFEQMCNEVYVFTTGDSPIEITYGNMTAVDEYANPLQNVEPGKKVIICDEVISDSTAEQNITYIFAAYTQSGRLIFTKAENVKVIPSEASQEVFEFTVPSSAEETAYYKMFRWNGLDLMKPLK